MAARAINFSWKPVKGRLNCIAAILGDFPFIQIARFVELIRAKYSIDMGDIQPLFLDADRSDKQNTGIYLAQLVGGKRPQCIGKAPGVIIPLLV